MVTSKSKKWEQLIDESINKITPLLECTSEYLSLNLTHEIFNLQKLNINFK